MSTFDAAAFKAKLARIAKVDLAHVTLQVTPASVAVTAHISCGSLEVAAAASDALHVSTATLSASLGVGVQRVSEIAIRTHLVEDGAPPPPLA